MRLELAFEIQMLASGHRKVTEETANGPVDVTSEVLAVQQDRFEQLEEMIVGFSRSSGRLASRM